MSIEDEQPRHYYSDTEFKLWYKSGQLSTHCYLKDGLKNGEYKWWWSSYKQIPGKLGVQCYYKNNKKEGEHRVWYPNGEEREHGYYINGILVSKDPKYFISGKKIQYWMRKLLVQKKYKKFIFLIECVPPNMPGVIGKLFPKGGYLYRKEVKYLN